MTAPLRRTALVGLALGLAAAVAPIASQPAWAGGPNEIVATLRASAGGGGTQPPFGSRAPVLSSNGRFLAFTDNGQNSVYVEDLETGATDFVSRLPSGVSADDDATPVGVSTDGNRVAFLTSATNLPPLPSSGEDLYVRDRTANTTTRVDLAANATTSPVANHEASMDDAGDAVVWTGTDAKIWYRKLAPAATQRIDVSSAEVGGTSTASEPHISGDGQHVVFTSASTNLVPGDTNNYFDVFERDLTNGTTERISVASGGVQILGASHQGSIDANGKVAAFVTTAKVNSNDTNTLADVYVRDVVGDNTLIMTKSFSDTSEDAASDTPVVAGDGASIVFRSDATNLATTDTGGHADFFQRWLPFGSAAIVDTSIGDAQGDASVSGTPAISADGGTIAFESDATNLLPSDANGHRDVFVRFPETLGPQASPSAVLTTALTRFDGPVGTAGTVNASVQAGATTIDHAIAGLAHAPAWAKDREPVARLYTAFFQREADLGGLNHWVTKHRTGTDLGPIATEFAKSSEFKTKYGSVDNSHFVKLVYVNVLGRQPDAAGAAHWTAKLGSGTSRGQVMVQFSESSEGKRRLAAPVDVTLISLGLLQKLPTKADFATLEQAFDAGGDEWVVCSILDSDAYTTSLGL